MKTKGSDSTVCARTKPSGVPVRCHRRNSEYMPIPPMSTGTTVGSSSTDWIVELPRNRERLSPRAAAVPSTVETTMTTKAICSELSPYV